MAEADDTGPERISEAEHAVMEVLWARHPLTAAEVCDEVVMAFDNTGWKSGCEQLNEVKEAYAERGRPLPTFD